MLSTQANIALQLLATLPESEIVAFKNEFDKLFTSQLANSTPNNPTNQKNQEKQLVQNLAQKILANHRAKSRKISVAI